MKSRLLLLLMLIMVAGCASQATGPKFDAASQPTIPANLARIYVMRDTVTYLAQAPAVVSAQIFIDGKPLGALKNGSFLLADVVPGQHAIIAASSDQTTRMVTAQSGVITYVAVWDRTRMIVPLVAEISAPVSEQDGRIWGVGKYSEGDAAKILPDLSSQQGF